MIRLRHDGILPGFRLATGYATTYLGLLVLLPLAAVAATATSEGVAGFWSEVSKDRTLAAYRLSIAGALAAAAINAVFGFIVAWVLARHRFPGRGLLDALVDLPLALPTAVAGIALTAVYSKDHLLGRTLDGLGISVAYTNAGVLMAMLLVSLPFSVRVVMPVIEDLEGELEEAAASLGASAWTTFRTVVLPIVFPAILTGLALSFAKAVGEYGSIIFISSNMQGRSEIAPLLIMTRLEEHDEHAAASIAMGLLLLSLLVLVTVNALQAWSRRRHAA
jgi:sulfate transport system permease protein